MRDKIAIFLVAAAALLLAFNLHSILVGLPDEAAQGAIYRIMFFHIPAAIVSMFGYFAALTLSLLYLSSKDLKFDSMAASVVEVSLVFSIINIITGSIWARIIWGIWWTWDYRLTSWLVGILIFWGYLMLRKAVTEPTQRARLSSALCLFGCVDVVIVYKSIEWFRTQHPGPVLSFRTGGGTMDPGMEHVLFMNFYALMMLAIGLVLIRTRQEAVAREVDSLRRFAHAV